MRLHSIMLAVVGMLMLPVVATATMPRIQHWTTGNGAQVYFVATSTLPIVDLRLVFDAGSARDGDTPGLAALTSSLLTEGTKERSAGEIARRFERYGAQVSTNSSRDTANLTLRSLSARENLQPTLTNLVHVLSAASFPLAAFERRREQMLVNLRQQQQDPDSIAERAFAHALFGKHPYANPPEGTTEGVRSITRDEVVAFHRRYYVAANAVIAMIGDLDRAQAEAIAQRISGSLPRGTRAPALPPVPELTVAKVVRKPFDSSQTHILIGETAISRTSPDYVPLYVANHVLGGNGLVSLLAEHMREKRGLSYNTSSYLVAAAQQGWFVLGSQVRNDQLDEALRVLRDTLQSFAVSGPSPQRLEAAKLNITGSFPLSLDSNREILSHVAMIGFYQLPLDYLQNFRKRVAGIARPTVLEAIQHHIDPRRTVTVLVGPKAVIDAAPAD